MTIDYAAAVRQVLARDFPVEPRAGVAARLADYGREPGQREPARVQLAVLYLSGSDPEKVEYYLQRAREDYRDLLCWAEYPLTAPSPASSTPIRTPTKHCATASSAPTGVGSRKERAPPDAR